MSGNRIECAARSCASAGEGAAKGVDIEVAWCGERKNCTAKNCTADFHEISVPTEQTILGQSFLGERLLR